MAGLLLFEFSLLLLLTLSPMNYLVAYLLLFSLQTVAPGRQDARAIQLMGEVATFGQNIQDFEAIFTYELKSASGNRRDLREVGQIQIFHGGLYRIQTPGQEIYMDGVNQWVVWPEENQAYVDYFQPGVGNVMSQIFALFTVPSRKTYLGESVCDGKACEKIVLTFTDPAAGISQAYLWIGKNPKMIRQAIFIDAWETTTSYTFSQFQLNTGLSPTDFTFDPNRYPNLQIEDKR